MPLGYKMVTWVQGPTKDVENDTVQARKPTILSTWCSIGKNKGGGLISYQVNHNIN